MQVHCTCMCNMCYIYLSLCLCIYICMYVCFMCINILLSIYTYTVHTMIKQCRTQQDELQQNLLKVHPDRNLPKKLPQISIDFWRSAKMRRQNKHGVPNARTKGFWDLFLGSCWVFLHKKSIKKMSDNMRFVEVAGASWSYYILLVIVSWCL